MLNDEALQYLDEAMFTSSLISKKERKKGRTDWENVYPRTKRETQQMADLLAKAAEVVEDPNDEEYRERYDALDDIVEWSQQRHRTWVWSLIAGALLGAGIFYYFHGEQKKDIARAKAEREQVEGWKEEQLKPLAWKDCPKEHASDAYSLRLTSAQKYKNFQLINIRKGFLSNEENAKAFAQRADTAKLQEDKERYLRNAAMYREMTEKRRAEYDSINAMDFAQVHEMALDNLNQHVSSEEGHGKALKGYMIYLLILIPLYIVTGYPHGYTITRHTRRTGCLNIFRKVGFAVASVCFGTGLAMSLLPDYQVKTYYAGGGTSTHTESDPMNFIVIAMKVGLMIVGAALFCFVSSTVMTVETISGLYNNFNWSGWMSRLKPAHNAEQGEEPTYAKSY